MTRTQLRDRVIDFVYLKVFCGPWLDRICWAVIVVALLYFSPVLLRIAGYEVTFADLVGYGLARF